MKLSNLFIVLILSALVFITGCKTETAKELIVKKWKFKEITGPNTALIPDSMKTKMFATMVMEFKKDGSYEQSGGMGDNTEKGTYTLSDDGKTIITKSTGSGLADTVMIMELSKTKMVVSPKAKEDQSTKITMIPK